MQKRIAFLVVLLLSQTALAQPAQEGTSGCSECNSLKDRLANGIARIESGPFDIVFHGRMNVWGGYVGEDSLLGNGDKMQKPGFRMRRVRFGVDGHLARPITYRIELDIFDQEKTGGPLYEGFVDWTPMHWIGATVGFMKLPFVRTAMNSSARLAHLDRAVGVNAMSPVNSLGLVLHSEPWEHHLTITAGVFNGLERKPGFFQGYQPIGVSEGNKFENLSYVARFDLEPLSPIGQGEPDLGKEPKFRLALGGGFLFNDGGSIRTLGASGFVHMKYYGIHLLGETVWDRSSPRAKPTTTNTIASTTKRLFAQGALGYVILKDMLGLAARVEYTDGNMDVSNEDDQVIVAGTLSWYALGHFLKVQAEYQYRHELHGVKVANDAALLGVQAAF